MSRPRKHRKGFTLIEVVVSIAIFAIIAVPTVGLMTMAARKSNNRVGYANAAELKVRVENEIRASDSAFDWNLDTTPIVLYGSRDLSETGFSDDEDLADSDKYYRVEVREPYGYDYATGDAYRSLIFLVTWPAYVETSPGTFVSNEANEANLEQMVMTSVIHDDG